MKLLGLLEFPPTTSSANVMSSSSSHQWKKFQFFDVEELQLDFLKEFGPTHCSSGRGQVLFGNAKGQCLLMNRNFERKVWQTHDGEIIACRLMKKLPILITIGDEGDESKETPSTASSTSSAASASSPATVPPSTSASASLIHASAALKIWHLDKSDADGSPVCSQTLRLFSPRFPPAALSCFDVLEDLSQCAIGFGNGAVLLLDGNLLRSPKSVLLLREGRGVVTGLYFREEDETAGAVGDADIPKSKSLSSLTTTALFIVTSGEVLSFFTKSSRAAEIRLSSHQDEGGAELQCSTLNDKGELLVARQPAIFSYSTEEKRELYVMDGMKKSLHFHNGYCVVVLEGKKHTLSIYELKSKYMAFTKEFEPILLIASEWQQLFIVCQRAEHGEYRGGGTRRDRGGGAGGGGGDWHFYQLVEKDLSTKMDILFKKNLYNIALKLAKNSGQDRAYLVDIFQKHGDHLYSKGDYDGAIQQYLETINTVEPSYVIRKFLDAQRIHNLTLYLEALHAKGKANEDHTTLLLSCYTKLKDVDKLNTFVKTDQGFHFDVKTAINVCRQAAYHEHALYLARKFAKHELFLKIQIEDQKSNDDAIKYLRSLPYEDADKYFRMHGASLVSSHPAQATTLCYQLCTAYTPVPYGSESDGTPTLPTSSSVLRRSLAEDFIHFFVAVPQWLTTFLEQVTRFDPKCSTVIYNTLLELYLQQYRQLLSQRISSSSASSSSSSSSSSEMEEKILSILKLPSPPYNVDQALVLCKRFDFEDGLLYLYSKHNLHFEILHYHMAHHQHKQIIDTCKKYGGEIRQLWIQALAFFAQEKHDCDEFIAEVLQQIEAQHLLPPYMVIQILTQPSKDATPAAASSKTLGVVKDYLIRCLSSETSSIASDAQLIAQYERETAAMKAEIDKMRNQPLTFQRAICAKCKTALYLPAIHFFCGHSLHYNNCHNEGDDCPECAREYATVINIVHDFGGHAHSHDEFSKRLEDSPDGWATVSDYFGRSIFDRRPTGNNNPINSPHKM